MATEQFNPKKIDQWLMWTILASISGTVIGIVAVTLLAALRERLGQRRPPPPRQADPRHPLTTLDYAKAPFCTAPKSG